MKGKDFGVIEYLNSLQLSLPQEVLAKHLAADSALHGRYTEREKNYYVQDVKHHLTFLAEAIALDSPIIFTHYLEWAKSLFTNLSIPHAECVVSLEIMEKTLRKSLPKNYSEAVGEYVKAGITAFNRPPYVIAPCLTDENPFLPLARDYLGFLIRGDRRSALSMIMGLFNGGVSIKELYLHIFQPVQLELGRLWHLNEITVAEEHFVTAATQMIMSQLYPFLFSRAANRNSVVVLCISGELHEIGARMVADFFEMDGWNSYYIGANTPSHSVISSIIKFQPKVLGISVTMPIHLRPAVILIDKIRSEPTIRDTKIIVGGYAFSLDSGFVEKVGADAYAANAEEAIGRANALVHGQ